MWFGEQTPGHCRTQEEGVLPSAGGGGDCSFAQVTSLTQLTWSVWKLSCVSDPWADLRLKQNGLFEIVEPAACFHLSFKPSVEFRTNQGDLALH